MNTPSDRKEREWHWEDTKEPMKKSTSAMGDGWAQSTMEALTDGAALRQEISEDITKAFGSAIQGTVLDSDSPKAGSINQAEISNDKKVKDWEREDIKAPMKKGSSAMSKGWAQSTMDTLTDGAALRQDISADITLSVGNAFKSAVLNATSPEEECADINMQSMSDSQTVLPGGDKANELDRLSEESNSSSLSATDSYELEVDNSPQLTM